MTESVDAFPVIMCGGSGTRLWPASRPARPKQFIALTGEKSLFSKTVERMIGVRGFRELVVVGGRAHVDWINAELASFDVDVRVLLEPEGRDSAAAIAAAVTHIESIDPTGLAIIVASDHHIPGLEAFHADIATACNAARDGGIVTLGIEPAGPSTAYGYIQAAFHQGAVGPVGAFKEKPDEQAAAQYIADGYLWNSGNFIARADTLVSAFQTHAPDILTAARQALAEGNRAGHAMTSALTLGDTFRRAPKISFDYAIMEKYVDRKVVRSKIEWSDLGAWDAVYAVAAKDAGYNAVSGDVIVRDATNCHVRNTSEKLVVVEGLAGLNLVVEEDVVFASSLDRAQSVKSVVDQLRKDGREEVDVAIKATGSAPDLDAVLERWERWHDTSVLPLWWSHGFDRERGIWQEHLHSVTGAPTSDPVRARVQGRQSYVFARAGQNGWSGPWLEAVEAGLKAIENVYAGRDGLVRTLVNHEGVISDNTVLLYDQAFILLALAEADGALIGAEQRALDCLDAIEERFPRGQEGKGFREAGSHPFQSNAHMHLLEASLAWSERRKNARFSKLAISIGELALHHFIDAEGGFLREFFAADWSPAEGDDGNVVEPGHQFEWAWLLARLGQMTGDKRYLAAARTLFACGLKGVDANRGVAVDTMNERLVPITTRARLWPQTEWLKAAALLAQNTNGTDREHYNEQVSNAVAAVDRFFSTPVSGLWRDKMNKDGSFEEEMSPASSLYHIVGAIDALRTCIPSGVNVSPAG